ncbi:MAG: hypothetical protein ACJ78U_06275, partial [Myxococcales bacterium]
GYFAVAGMEMLPHKTEAQKRVVLVVAVAVLLVFATLIATMIRLIHHRRRVSKEWKGRQEPPPENPLD